MVDHVKEATSVITGTFAATWRTMVGSWVRAFGSACALVIGFAIFYAWKGGEAVSTLAETLRYAVVPLILFAVVFFWHLWLAPYRMMDRDRKQFEASLLREVGAIRGSVDHIRQVAETFSERGPAFEAEIRKAVSDHLAEVEEGWNNLERRMMSAPDGAVQLVRHEFQMTERQLAESRQAFQNGATYLMECGNRFETQMQEVAERTLAEMKSAVAELDDRIARVSPPAAE